MVKEDKSKSVVYKSQSFSFYLGKVQVKSSDIRVGDLIVVDKVKVCYLH